jgi:N-acetylmuramoyl-L-alanine amidase
MLRDIRWRQRESDVVEIDAALTTRLWGYRARWDRNDLVLELRPRPDIDAARPLQGLTIVVDPGHPPLGARGPSGLTEAEANLGVALVLERLLAEEGAQVILTRRDGKPVELWPRVKFADSVGAHLLVSIHNNALPDGVNPFSNNGSSVFYFHPRGVPLARAIQTELGRRLPLRTWVSPKRPRPGGGPGCPRSWWKGCSCWFLSRRRPSGPRPGGTPTRMPSGRGSVHFWSVTM